MACNDDEVGRNCETIVLARERKRPDDDDDDGNMREEECGGEWLCGKALWAV